LFTTDYYNCILQASGSAAVSACFPILGTEVQACNQQKHKDMVSMCIKYNKRNITGEDEQMDTDAEEDSEEHRWTCDMGFSEQCCEGSSLVQCDTMV
jgi:hypothetical protein